MEQLQQNQRDDIDKKVELLHKNWTDLKNLLESRVDLSSVYISFHQETEILSSMFDYLENVLKTTADDEKLTQIEVIWNKIKPAYAQLKITGSRFINDASKVGFIFLFFFLKSKTTEA